MADVPAGMAAAGTEFAAEEHHDATKLAAKVESLEGGASPSPGAPGAAAPAAAPAPAPAALLPDETAQKLCKSIVLVIDRVVVSYTVPELKLTTEEVDQISIAAVPVLNKHLPDLIAKLAGTVEGQFVLAVALIYASKAPGLLFPPPAPKPPEKAAPAAPSSPPAEAAA